MAAVTIWLRQVWLWCALGCLAGLAAPAAASGWQRAESAHYVVHADLTSAQLREVMQEMEDFRRILHQLLPLEIAPGRKLELYLTPDSMRISRIHGLSVSGFDHLAPDAMLAMAAFDPAHPPGMRHEAAFFYAAGYHLEQALQQPVPPWLASGFPSFLATTYPLGEGGHVLGAPHPSRPRGRPASRAELLGVLSAQTSPGSQARYERFFEVARQIAAVLLTDPRYAGAIERHVAAYAAGASMAAAAGELGDPALLEAAIAQSHAARPPLLRRITLAPAPPAAISLSAMSREEIALIAPRFRRYYPRHRAANARTLRALTERFADSALVWYEYAANEFARAQHSAFGGDPVFGGLGFANGELLVVANPYSDAEAWRAVNRALALDPAMAAARRLRAEILLHRLVRAGDSADEAAYDEVRGALAPLARMSAAEPLAAALYHQTFIEQGRTPPAHALAQLAAAFRANAAVPELRYAYAAALSRAGQTAEARRLLTALRNDPRFAPAVERVLEQAP